jgi:hypothetical protein
MLAAQRLTEATQKVKELNTAYENMSVAKFHNQASRIESGQTGTFNASVTSMLGVGGYYSKMLNLVGKLVANTEQQKTNTVNNKTTIPSNANTQNNEYENKLIALSQEQTRLLREISSKSKSGNSALTFS